MLATGAIFAVLILFERSPAIYVQIALLITASLFAGNYLFIYADQTLSYPHARSIFSIPEVSEKVFPRYSQFLADFLIALWHPVVL